MRDRMSNRGAVTVEAAIVLPVFICVVVGILFFIKVAYTYGVVQHAIDSTADEMAVSSYLYAISGLQELHDTARDGLTARAEVFEEHQAQVLGSYQALANLLTDAHSSGQADIKELEELEETADTVSSNPLQEVKSAAASIAKGVFEDLKTEICIPLVRIGMKKYLTTDMETQVDRRLLKLNVINGFNGLDFSRSSFFENQENEVDLIVSYRIRIPVPIRIFPEVCMVQRACARAWLGSDRMTGSSDTGEPTEEDIWSLGNFQRGIQIRKIFGANLPDTFPVIASFSGGTATMIKSMDLTTPYYQDSLQVEAKLNGYIRELWKYEGQEKPWGSKGIAVKPEDIITRRLLLVIPDNPAAPGVEAALQRCMQQAAASGIVLEVRRYGTKQTGDGEAQQEVQEN